MSFITQGSSIFEKWGKMKFKIKVKSVGNPEPWWEEYSENIENAQLWAEKTILAFNNSLRPGETMRTLLAVEVDEVSGDEFHEWDKDIKGMSVNFRGECVDLMRCKKCGITGKRFGLRPAVIIDSKYRKKLFKNCREAKKEMKFFK